jgi:hypothetical protein
MKPVFAVTTTLSAEGTVIYNSTQKTDNLNEALKFINERKGEVGNVFPSMTVEKTKTGFVAKAKNGLQLTVSLREDVTQYTDRIKQLEKDLAAASANRTEPSLIIGVFVLLVG